MKFSKSCLSALAGIGSLMIFATASVSCSLKEDRNGCPCHLLIELKNAEGNENADIFVFQSDDENLNDRVVPSACQNLYVCDVRRKPATLTIIQGLREGIINDGRLMIKDGNDADRLFLHNETLLCGSETVRTTAELHKDWTTLEISLVTEEGATDEITIDITGGICGIDLRSGKPLTGNFSCRARLVDSGFSVYSINLPRQKVSGDGILVNVRRGERELFSADISEAIDNSGFDWTKPDLDDIRLHLDYVSASYDIEVTEWDEEIESDRII